MSKTILLFTVAVVISSMIFEGQSLPLAEEDDQRPFSGMPGLIQSQRDEASDALANRSCAQIKAVLNAMNF